MLRERHSSRAITICDASQLLLVERSLFFLACTAGEAEVAVYKDWISSMVTAQDLVLALAKHKADTERRNIPEQFSYEEVDREFKVSHLQQITPLIKSQHVRHPKSMEMKVLNRSYVLSSFLSGAYRLCL
ncbi:unnamed protein product [Cylicostephanus goldi]|uniref:Uncharacterized protein n=1 Tax=Cylicostephanus goldi TaxID=71465 RepID=A0A3P7LRU3_CYLGO|nr:unnamed protein product [Cylicostephanus goldi]